MKTIQAHIDSKQQEFMNHPFFNVLEGLNSLEEIGYFVPELTFWAMTFQDILRLNETKMSDPYLKKVARHHRLEDAGHEKWFLHDKKYMNEKSLNKNLKQDDIAWLFSKDCELTRDAAYSLMSELYRPQDEMVRIAFVLTLESTGHVFFEKVSKQVKKTGEDKNLQYFSTSHLDVEMAHAVFEEEMEKKLFERELSLEVRREALQMIDRCYEAFNSMFDGLLLACEKRGVSVDKRMKQNDSNNMGFRENHTV